MSSGDGKRRRVLSAEERVLWTTVTKSIAPLRESSESGDDGSIGERHRPAETLCHEAAANTAVNGGPKAPAACPARPPDEAARCTRQGRD